MNWNEAKEKISKTQGVKLPEMKGYWIEKRIKYDSLYGKGGYTSIFWVGDGKERESPAFDENEFTKRTDWQLCKT